MSNPENFFSSSSKILQQHLLLVGFWLEYCWSQNLRIISWEESLEKWEWCWVLSGNIQHHSHPFGMLRAEHTHRGLLYSFVHWSHQTWNKSKFRILIFIMHTDRQFTNGETLNWKWSEATLRHGISGLLIKRKMRRLIHLYNDWLLPWDFFHTAEKWLEVILCYHGLKGNLNSIYDYQKSSKFLCA